MDGEDKFSQRIDINDTENIPVKPLHFVGLMLFRGDGGTKNYAEAAKWFSRAAGREFKRRKLTDQERTSIFMQSLLNHRMVNFNNEDPVDLDSYGNQCIASSQYYLGFMYLRGLGVKQDHGESVKWLSKAAEFGHEEAEYLLGLAYSSGLGIGQDFEEAAKWFRKAAGQGNAEAQNALGDACSSGQGIGQDYEEAAEWYRKAAEQGIAAAQKSLGDLYNDGKGVEQDQSEATKWYMKAAKQGNAEARDRLQEIFGDLPKKNLVHR